VERVGYQTHVRPKGVPQGKRAELETVEYRYKVGRADSEHLAEVECSGQQAERQGLQNLAHHHWTLPAACRSLLLIIHITIR
jgi:hypothetical protein